MRVHDLNFRLSICDAFGFIQPGVTHECGQDAFAQVMEYVPWRIFGRIIERHAGRCGYVYFRLRRSVSSDGLFAVDLARVLHISDGKMGDVNILDILPIEAGAFYVMDRDIWTSTDCTRCIRRARSSSRVPSATWVRGACIGLDRPIHGSNPTIIGKAGPHSANMTPNYFATG